MWHVRGKKTHSEGLREYGAEDDVGNLRELYNVDCEGGEIKEDEMGGECSTHAKKETFSKSFSIKVEGKKL